MYKQSVLSRQSQPTLFGHIKKLPTCIVLKPNRCVIRKVAEAEKEGSVVSKPVEDVKISSKKKAFPYQQPMDNTQRALANVPLFLMYSGMLLFMGAVGYVGSLFGRSMPVDPNQKNVSSAVVASIAAVAAGVGAVRVKKMRDTAAVIDLYNSVVDLEDPALLSRQDVENMNRKYGLDLARADPDGVKRIFAQFLESIIPLGDNQLTGSEVPQVSSFRTALGLSDAAVAEVFLELGKRFTRAGSMGRSIRDQFDQKKALSRLIYVSQVVMGEQRAAELLPWRAQFNLSDAQVFVALRDNAKAVFRNVIESLGGELKAERDFLQALRIRQSAARVLDESAAEVVGEAARRYVEKRVNVALQELAVQARFRNKKAIVDQMYHIIDYSRALDSLSYEEGLVPGLGPVTLLGGPLGESARSRELKELYRLFLEDVLEAAGEVTSELEADATDLANILSLKPRDAQVVRDEVAATLYKTLLKEEVASKRLDNAKSPATILEDLCNRVKFSPEAALQLHAGLYKQKAAALLAEHNKLSEEDSEELKRIRRILCLPGDVVKKALKETCGKVLESALREIFSGGLRPLSEAEGKKIESLVKDLRLEQDVAVDVLSQVSRSKFREYLTAAQKETDRKAGTALLRRMLQFNALLVTPLLSKVKGLDAANKELAELMMKAKEAADKEAAAEASTSGAAAAGSATPALPAPGETLSPEARRLDMVKQVQKAIQANRGEFGQEEKNYQKEINLKNDLEAAKRADVYKSFLMSTMQPDTTELQFGGAIKKKPNSAERQQEMGRLQQLGEILGMSQAEVYGIHGELTEMAFKGQATEIMKSGPWTEERAGYLEEIRTQLGLSKEAGEKLIKAARTEVYGSAAAPEDGGRWTAESLLSAIKAGGKVEDLAEERTRRNLFRRELEKRVTDGSGDLDAEHVLNELPTVLALEPRKVKSAVKEVVETRKRMLLVQAVSQMKQQRMSEVLASLNNLISCAKALPSDVPLAWSEHDDLAHVYNYYCSKEHDEAKQSLLKSVLGISDEEVRVEGNVVDVLKGLDREEAFF